MPKTAPEIRTDAMHGSDGQIRRTVQNTGKVFMKNKIRSFFLYCTLTKEEFDSIRPSIWRRNRKILSITSLLGAAMSGIFLIVNMITRSGIWQPYVFLLSGSILVSIILRILKGRDTKEWIDRFLCYTEMIYVCMYAGILSTQKSNFDVPATSIIVFISILPLTIDDRPARMYGFMAAESAVYLTASCFFKSPGSFRLDILNVSTFCVVGMFLYAVICIRNVREIYQSKRVENIQQSVISSLAAVVEERDENTGGHINRTQDYVRKLVALMRTQEKYSYLTDDYCKNIILAAPMHDVGKIKIPDNILDKPGRLTPEEFEIMKKHAVFGEDIIRKTMRDVEDEEYFNIAANTAKYHHERFDGKGYPDGLAGEDIPLEARIMALADVYDALVSERVYKKPVPKDEAARIIREGSGTQFDPDLVPLFLSCVG